MISQTIDRRGLLAAGAAALLVTSCARAASPGTLVVYKTPYCGCCKGWVAHMSRRELQRLGQEIGENLAEAGEVSHNSKPAGALGSLLGRP